MIIATHTARLYVRATQEWTASLDALTKAWSCTRSALIRDVIEHIPASALTRIDAVRGEASRSSAVATLLGFGLSAYEWHRAGRKAACPACGREPA
jgi:hypothetical protein